MAYQIMLIGALQPEPLNGHLASMCVRWKVSRLLLAGLARRAPLLPGQGTVAFLGID